jgi:hypothetical protein
MRLNPICTTIGSTEFLNPRGKRCKSFSVGRAVDQLIDVFESCRSFTWPVSPSHGPNGHFGAKGGRGIPGVAMKVGGGHDAFGDALSAPRTATAGLIAMFFALFRGMQILHRGL